ncbi:hypothetical protein [Glycomyces sp. NPDC048151]|uniref:hypothetical protein n=1 Tax=Glycomyces sp. NPDC048151 TaxID=3364002 RepID=UPI00371F3C67
MFILTTSTIDPAARLARGYDYIRADFQSYVADPEMRALTADKGAAEFTIDLTSGLYLTHDRMRLAALTAYAIGDAILSDVDTNRKDS